MDERRDRTYTRVLAGRIFCGRVIPPRGPGFGDPTPGWEVVVLEVTPPDDAGKTGLHGHETPGRLFIMHECDANAYLAERLVTLTGSLTPPECLNITASCCDESLGLSRERYRRAAEEWYRLRRDPVTGCFHLDQDDLYARREELLRLCVGDPYLDGRLLAEVLEVDAILAGEYGPAQRVDI